MIKDEYVQRINQAIDYIHSNLDRNLTAEELADHCRFSRFYFGRMFQAVVGESVYSFLKRRKLENSAFLLRTRTDLSVTDIALLHGYSPSNFASAFRDHFGISATEYRKTRNNVVRDTFPDIVEHIRSLKMRDDCFELINSKIRIRRLEKMNLLYRRFIGNYFDLAGCWEEFCRAAEERSLIRRDTRFVGISYDDPLVGDENKCIYDVCISVDHAAGTSIHRVEEGWYACYRFEDRLIHLGKSYNEIFSFWIPFCGYQVENRLPIEIYHRAPDEEGRTVMDLCIPMGI